MGSREAIDRILSTLSPQEQLALAHDWRLWARPEQVLPDGKWDIWIILSGRGWGKTRALSESVREWVNKDGIKRIHLVARTAADARDTMIEGDSGILRVCENDLGNTPTYNPSKRKISWPNGAIALIFSAEEPDALRGPQCERWAADELASWKYLNETWDMLQMGARLGPHVQGIITTTPRPHPLLKKLVTRAKSGDGSVIITRGRTLDNKDNLSPNFLRAMMEQYGGTRLGRQELEGEILDDNPNALWTRDMIQVPRVTKAPSLYRVVVGVDPNISHEEDADECGIVAVGKDRSRPAQFYVLEDASIPHPRPQEWAEQAIACYWRHKAFAMVVESNQGGDMVEHTIHTIDGRVNVIQRKAKQGKGIRAEPVSALYEQGRVHHVGLFPLLEDQMVEWEPIQGASSPDRLDGLVHAITELNEKNSFMASSWVNRRTIGV